jgi:hypothetical protein
MPTGRTNRGIVQHGGSIDAGQLAVGDGATNVRSGDDVATIGHETLRLVLNRIEELQAAASHAPGAVEARIKDATSELAAELTKSTPSKSRLRSFLATLRDTGKTVTALGPAVQAVVKVVGLLL